MTVIPDVLLGMAALVSPEARCTSMPCYHSSSAVCLRRKLPVRGTGRPRKRYTANKMARILAAAFMAARAAADAASLHRKMQLAAATLAVAGAAVSGSGACRCCRWDRGTAPGGWCRRRHCRGSVTGTGLQGAICLEGCGCDSLRVLSTANTTKFGHVSALLDAVTHSSTFCAGPLFYRCSLKIYRRSRSQCYDHGTKREFRIHL